MKVPRTDWAASSFGKAGSAFQGSPASTFQQCKLQRCSSPPLHLVNADDSDDHYQQLAYGYDCLWVHDGPPLSRLPGLTKHLGRIVAQTKPFRASKRIGVGACQCARSGTRLDVGAPRVQNRSVRARPIRHPRAKMRHIRHVQNPQSLRDDNSAKKSDIYAIGSDERSQASTMTISKTGLLNQLPVPQE